MPRKGGRRKKKRTQPVIPRPGDGGGAIPRQGRTEDSEVDNTPRSMIVRRGKTGKAVTELVRELRRIMAPNTAERLRERAGTSIRDLAEAGAALKVSHLLLLSESSTGDRVTLRVARLPQGPTLEFQVMSFQLSKHVRKEQDQPYETPYIYATPPLLVLSGLSKTTQPQTKLTRATLQALFPAMDVTAVKLTDCRRAVLCSHDETSGDALIDLRHYAIQARTAGVSKPIRDVVLARKPPDLSKLKHVAQYIDPSTKNNLKAENDKIEEDQIELDSKFLGPGNLTKRKSSITLAELGPRLTLRLTKVQKGLCDGPYLFNSSSQEDTATKDSAAQSNSPRTNSAAAAAAAVSPSSTVKKRTFPSSSPENQPSSKRKKGSAKS